jgi:hypothetical protein
MAYDTVSHERGGYKVYLFNFTIALPQGEVLKPPQLQL